jgi:AAA domain-containing protein/recombination endonuclease VII/Homeodomain-like domain-containing protein
MNFDQDPPPETDGEIDAKRARKRASQKKYRQSHKPELAEAQRRRRENDPELREAERERARLSSRKRVFETVYGITFDDFDAMVARQGGLCILCAKRPALLCVDHCHETSRVRALLCGNCNSMLGFSGDDPELLDDGAFYLRIFRDDPEQALALLLQRLAARLQRTQSPTIQPTITKPETGNSMTHTSVTPPDMTPPDDDSRFRALDLDELYALDIKPRGMVLDPIIPEKGLAMIYSGRGVGKTHMSLGIGYAVATGSTFLKWRAPQARRVLVLDGEMKGEDLRERLRSIQGGETPTPKTLKVVSADVLANRGKVDGIGDIGSPQVQARLELDLEGVELLILDNLSSLTEGTGENDADGWARIQQWLLRLRRRSISVLIIHHANKIGEQRGTSRREDVLDTSIRLRHPDDYSIAQGARFEVHIAKGRGIHGDAARPFEAWLKGDKTAALWTMREIEDRERTKVAELLAKGASVRDIADEIGISKSSVHRLKRRIEQERKAEDAADGGT